MSIKNLGNLAALSASAFYKGGSCVDMDTWTLYVNVDIDTWTLYVSVDIDMDEQMKK